MLEWDEILQWFLLGLLTRAVWKLYFPTSPARSTLDDYNDRQRKGQL